MNTKKQPKTAVASQNRQEFAKKVSGWSDDQVRQQVNRFEAHNDIGWEFWIIIAEYRKRGLREHGDWQDAGETLAGA